MEQSDDATEPRSRLAELLGREPPLEQSLVVHRRLPVQQRVLPIQPPRDPPRGPEAARARNRRFWLLSALRAHTKKHTKPIYCGKR